ncbi:hypothetical protein ACFL35_11340 [Candidatus Riflebacteria bacterium]
MKFFTPIFFSLMTIFLYLVNLGHCQIVEAHLKTFHLERFKISSLPRESKEANFAFQFPTFIVNVEKTPKKKQLQDIQKKQNGIAKKHTLSLGYTPEPEACLECKDSAKKGYFFDKLKRKYICTVCNGDGQINLTDLSPFN